MAIKIETTDLSSLQINVLTQSQYEAATKYDDQLYLITDDFSELPSVDATHKGMVLMVDANGTWQAKALTTEAWEFKFSDGTTATKNVVIIDEH